MTSTIKTVVHEVPGRGFQRRSAIFDSSTGELRCYRAGGIPYAVPLTPSQRWKPAQPLPNDFHYGTREEPTDFTGLANECPQPELLEVESAQMSEDCLQLNIWIPAGEKPDSGWPVFFYIHGGFLQWGSPNYEDPSALLSSTTVRAIFVAPAYRLNALGFLAHPLALPTHNLSASIASSIVTPNVGFHDQSLALTWTYTNIPLYGGDASNITVGGLSAGAYSTFHQLAHSLALPATKSPIRRVVMWSNGCGLQPKPPSEVASHFSALTSVLGIPSSLTMPQQLARLRAVSWQDLMRAVARCPTNAFRAVTDNIFVRDSLFAEIHSGAFAIALRRRGIKIMIGDVRDEANSYRLISPPSSYSGLVDRLAVEYPRVKSERLAKLYCPKGELPDGTNPWQNIFGRIYADVQVHVTERGLLESLASRLGTKDVFRYRIEWRPKCVDKVMPPAMGVAHGSDLAIWFFGNGKELKTDEKELVKEFLNPWGRFLRGEDEIGWGTRSIEEVRRIGEAGDLKVVKDGLWGRCLEIWRGVHGLGRSKL